MSERIFNFSAGPSVLPEEVLRAAQEALWDLDGTGIGVLEHSHRGAAIDELFARTESDCRKLGGIPDDYAVLFLQGGATAQFHMVPANFLPDDGTADYLHTGIFAGKAIQDARRIGNVHVAASSKEGGFTRIPTTESILHSERPVYLHFTSNNTIVGTQFRQEPKPPGETWLCCDASSDIYSRPLEIAKYGLIYAGAQKNLGPAGLTLVLIRRDLLDQTVRELPDLQAYGPLAAQSSRLNTPPVFGVYVTGQVFRWLEARGGLEAMAKRNDEKAQILYRAIDASGFFQGTAHTGSRSHMNLTFRSPDAELDTRFVAEAAKQGLSGLKGHRAVGGMRASLYNAFPKAGVEALVAFMGHFEARNG